MHTSMIPHTNSDGAPEPPNVCCSALERGLADLRCLANEHNERRATAFGQLFDAVRQRAQAPDEEAKAASTATAVSLLSQLAYDIGGVGQDVLLTVAVHVQSQHNVDELLAQGASPLMRVAHFSTLQVAVFLQQYTMLEHMLQSLTCACSAAPDAPLMRCTDITEGASHCLCCDDAAPEVRVAYGKADCAAVRTELMAALITATLLGDLDACGVLVKSMQRFREARFLATLPHKLPDMVGKLYHTAAPLAFLAAAMGHTALLQQVLLPACLHEARGTRPVLSMAAVHDGMLDNEGWTMLMTAACSGHAETVLMLCQQGATTGMVTKIERSALWLAALRGHVSVCQVLLDAGADIELSEECGFTPLLVAAAQGHTETVAALHARGARLHARTKNGATAAVLACRYARVDVLRWLLEHGALGQLSMSDTTSPSAFAIVARELGQVSITEASAAAYRQILETLLAQHLIPSHEEARDLLINISNCPSRDGWQTAWQVLSHAHNPHQLLQFTSVEQFYLLPRGAPPQQQPLRTHVIATLMESIVHMLSSFLYNLAPELSLGRRPAYLLTMMANALLPEDLPDAWRGTLKQLWEQTRHLMHVLVTMMAGLQHRAGGMGVAGAGGVNSGVSGAGSGASAAAASAAVLGSPEALLGRLGNLLTAFHDARRLLWPYGEDEEEQIGEGEGGGVGATQGVGGQPLVMLLQAHADVLNTTITTHANDLVAWHFLLHYSNLLTTPLKHALLRSEIRIAHGPSHGPSTAQGPSLEANHAAVADETHTQSETEGASGPGLGGGRSGPVTVQVERGAVLESMCEEYSEGRGLGASFLRDVAVKFTGETGVGDGLRREWLSLVAQQFLSLDHGLMESPDGGRTFHLSVHSNVHEGHLHYFEMMGRVCGLALLHGAPLPGFHLTRPLRRLMLRQSLDTDELHVVDAQMANALQMLAEGSLSVDDLCLTFTTHDALGREVELLPHGAGIDVTEDNKHEYISLLTQHKLLGAVKEQTGAFLKGWQHVIPPRILDLMSRCLSTEELDVLLAGLTHINMDDWQQHTRYVGCDATTPQIEWFWSLVHDMSDRERALLLAFVTGSSAPPAGGFAELLGFNGGRARFSVHLLAHESGERLPRARTCFNALYLPSYESRAQLTRALQQAIHSQTLFDESLWH